MPETTATSSYLNRPIRSLEEVRAARKPLRHHSGLIASALAALVNGDPAPGEAVGLRADERQDNHAWGVKQLRIRLPGDDQDYRIIIAPADAPIAIGGTPADRHFSYALGEMPAHQDETP